MASVSDASSLHSGSSHRSGGGRMSPPSPVNGRGVFGEGHKAPRAGPGDGRVGKQVYEPWVQGQRGATAVGEVALWDRFVAMMDIITKDTPDQRLTRDELDAVANIPGYLEYLRRLRDYLQNVRHPGIETFTDFLEADSGNLEVLNQGRLKAQPMNSKEARVGYTDYVKELNAARAGMGQLRLLAFMHQSRQAHGWAFFQSFELNVVCPITDGTWAPTEVKWVLHGDNVLKAAQQVGRAISLVRRALRHPNQITLRPLLVYDHIEMTGDCTKYFSGARFVADDGSEFETEHMPLPEAHRPAPLQWF